MKFNVNGMPLETSQPTLIFSNINMIFMLTYQVGMMLALILHDHDTFFMAIAHTVTCKLLSVGPWVKF
jgi:hypothetical protein